MRKIQNFWKIPPWISKLKKNQLKIKMYKIGGRAVVKCPSNWRKIASNLYFFFLDRGSEIIEKYEKHPQKNERPLRTWKKMKTSLKIKFRTPQARHEININWVFLKKNYKNCTKVALRTKWNNTKNWGGFGKNYFRVNNSAGRPSTSSSFRIQSGSSGSSSEMELVDSVSWASSLHSFCKCENRRMN